MKKEKAKNDYCLYISGKLIKNLTQEFGTTTKPLFKVDVQIIKLSEEECTDATIKRLLVNRLPENMEVLMYEEPNKHNKKLFCLKKEKGANHLILVVSGIFY
jgi:hypothetical protein